MFRPYLDMFIDNRRFPDWYKNESWHKTDCCNVLSDLGAISAGNRRRGRPVENMHISHKSRVC